MTLNCRAIREDRKMARRVVKAREFQSGIQRRSLSRLAMQRFGIAVFEAGAEPSSPAPC